MASLAGGLLIGSLEARDRTPFKFFDPESEASVPKKISQSGLFANILSKVPVAGVYKYEVNSPLWSDAAQKERYIILPNDSLLSFVDDTSAYRFPQGTVFVKNFAFDTVQGKPASRVLLETRLLVLKGETWHGFSYKWDSDQKDARLVGSDEPVPDLDKAVDTTYTLKRADGKTSYRKKWHFPSRNECARCHVPEGREVLGFMTMQLNRPAMANPSLNQITDFIQKGLFRPQGAPNLNGHKWAALDDPSQSVAHRARSYLASNCSNCHGQQGIDAGATVVFMNLDYFSPSSPQEYLDTPTWKQFDMKDAQIVSSGKPEKSGIYYRLTHKDTSVIEYQDAPMPPLATGEIDSSAEKVIREWILSLTPGAALRHTYVHSGKKPWISRGLLHIPSLSRTQGNLELTDARGRNIPLEKADGGLYRLCPSGKLSPGLLFLRVGKESYRLTNPQL